MLELLDEIRRKKSVPYNHLEREYRFRRGIFLWEDKHRLSKGSIVFEIMAFHDDGTVDLAIVYSLNKGPYAVAAHPDLHTMRMFSRIPLSDAKATLNRHLTYLQNWLLGKIMDYKGNPARVIPAQPKKLRQAEMLAMRLGMLFSSYAESQYKRGSAHSPLYKEYEKLVQEVSHQIRKALKHAGGRATSPITYEEAEVPRIIEDFLEYLRISPLPQYEQYELGVTQLKPAIDELLQSIDAFRSAGELPSWAKKLEVMIGTTTP